MFSSGRRPFEIYFKFFLLSSLLIYRFTYNICTRSKISPLIITLPRQLRLQMLINRISDSLARRNAHDPRRDAFIQRLETFLLEERARNGDGV